VTLRTLYPFLLLLSLAVVTSAMLIQTIKTGTLACAVTHPNGVQPPVKDFGGTMTYAANHHGPRTFPVHTPTETESCGPYFRSMEKS
jgi:hypothetical protein